MFRPLSGLLDEDGPIRAETCRLVYNKHDVLDVKLFYYYFNITSTHQDVLKPNE